VKPQRLRLVFADSPEGSGDGEPSGEPEGKTYLLHIASARKVRGFTAPVTMWLLKASGQLEIARIEIPT
jgi:hypothetical protein